MLITPDRFAVEVLGAKDTPMNAATGQYLLLNVVSAALGLPMPSERVQTMVVLSGEDTEAKSAVLVMLAGLSGYTDSYQCYSTPCLVPNQAALRKSNNTRVFEIATFDTYEEIDKRFIREMLEQSTDIDRFFNRKNPLTWKRRWFPVGTAKHGYWKEKVSPSLQVANINCFHVKPEVLEGAIPESLPHWKQVIAIGHWYDEFFEARKKKGSCGPGKMIHSASTAVPMWCKDRGGFRCDR